MGLSVIAVGIVCALPFRHTLPDEAVAVGGFIDRSSSLDEGVPLQVPGQQAVASFSPSALRPLLVEKEASSEVERQPAEEPLLVATEPPNLPDQYRPLFRPENSEQLSTGGAAQPPATDARPARKPVRQHTIHDGDTLASLARRYYQDPQRAGDILEANRAVLSDPQVLPIGVKIVIPRQPAESAVSDSRSDMEPPAKNLVPLPAIGLRRGH